MRDDSTSITTRKTPNGRRLQYTLGTHVYIALSTGHVKRLRINIGGFGKNSTCRPMNVKSDFPTPPNTSFKTGRFHLSLADNQTSSLTGQLMIPISGILANSISPSTSIFLVFSSNIRNATCKALHPSQKMADDDNTKMTHSVASGCPTQRCLPRPNPMCIAMLGRCSTKSWGFSNTAGSRLAAL